MIINLGNKKYIAITVIKSSQNEDLYEYYMGDTKIGVLNPKVMEDNILILENTLENELAGQIRDCINNISREDIEEEGELSAKIDSYLKKLEEKEAAKSVTLVELEEENEEEQEEEKDEDKTSTIDDVNVKQTVELDERANDMHDVRKWFGLPQDVEKIRCN